VVGAVPDFGSGELSHLDFRVSLVLFRKGLGLGVNGRRVMKVEPGARSLRLSLGYLGGTDGLALPMFSDLTPA